MEEALIDVSAHASSDKAGGEHGERVLGDLLPFNLRCEHLDTPMGIEATQPRLSWLLKSDEVGQCQTAYQIIAARSPELLKQGRGDLWDTGRMLSNQTVNILYAGTPPGTRQRCFWKVRVWDKDGKASAWSETAQWEMGLLEPADWQAHWIARTTDIHEPAAPRFRREFKIDGQIKRGRVYLSGLGYNVLSINGRKVGDHLLDPGYTRYDRRVLYVTHDVTEILQQGLNAVGVELGNGWLNVQYRNAWDFDRAPWRAAPMLLFSLYVELAGGKVMLIGSDTNWKCASGPTTFNVIYGGETCDARLEQAGWSNPGFKDSTWLPAIVVKPPGGKLVAQVMPPIKVDEIFEPVSYTEPEPGIFVFDFGQNFAGFAQLKITGAAGTKITMKYGERLLPNGRVDQAEIAQHVVRFDAGQRFQTDTYILNGGGEERWHPQFVYHGFQYVEVSGLPGKPAPKTVTGVFIHSAVPAVGEFECSNPLFNKIWQATRRAYLSNLHGLPTDCPHREKNGWTADAHIACEQGLFNFDSVTVYEKWLSDLADEQQPGGALPGIVPTGGWGYEWGNGPAWDSAFVLIPFYLYQYYGDTAMLREHYQGMKRYVDYLTSKAKDGIVDIGLDDWAPFKTKTPAAVTSTGYYYRDALVVSLAASLLGEDKDAITYSELAARIKSAFNRHFSDAETGSYANGSQTALSCALYHGLAEPDQRERVLQSLVANIEQRNGHIDTGLLGAKYLLNVLSENGRHDVAYRVASQTDLPGWGWWIAQGATTLWEEWDGRGSRNHIMFGDISAWFFKTLAGINPDPAAPGFQHFIIKPIPAGDLTSARANYESIRGRITSDWKIEANRLELRVVIPPNTSATVHVPGTSVTEVSHNEMPAANAKGVELLTEECDSMVLKVAAGTYRFVAHHGGNPSGIEE
jgi:alpha-L-rhamnosidase